MLVPFEVEVEVEVDDSCPRNPSVKQKSLRSLCCKVIKNELRTCTCTLRNKIFL